MVNFQVQAGLIQTLGDLLGVQWSKKLSFCYVLKFQLLSIFCCCLVKYLFNILVIYISKWFLCTLRIILCYDPTLRPYDILFVRVIVGCICAWSYSFFRFRNYHKFCVKTLSIENLKFSLLSPEGDQHQFSPNKIST